MGSKEGAPVHLPPVRLPTAPMQHLSLHVLRPSSTGGSTDKSGTGNGSWKELICILLCFSLIGCTNPATSSMRVLNIWTGNHTKHMHDYIHTFSSTLIFCWSNSVSRSSINITKNQYSDLFYLKQEETIQWLFLFPRSANTNLFSRAFLF